MRNSLFKGIEKIDTSNHLEKILKFPEQIIDSLKIVNSLDISKLSNKRFKEIFFCGMGGSGIAGDILKILFFNTSLPFFVIKDYDIPSFLNKDSLCFISSFSGNTEETLSCFKKAKKITENIVCVSTGGILKKLSKKFIFIKIPSDFVPRQALGYSFFIPYFLLCRLGILKKVSYREIVTLLKGSQKSFCKRAKLIATHIYKKLPIIYCAQFPLEPVALRIKAQFNENSKNLCWVNFFPELNHNEIVGLQFPKEVFKYIKVIFLRTPFENERVRLRIEITKKILEKKDIKFLEVKSCGKSILSHIFYLIHLFDLVSFYLAILNKIDPTPVKIIDYLKKELRKR